jgi:hypothetical protein
MDDDPRLLVWCRMWLLAGAAIHWVAVGIVLWQRAEAERLATRFYTLCCALIAQVQI